MTGCCHNSMINGQAVSFTVPSYYSSTSISSIAIQYWPGSTGSTTFNIGLMAADAAYKPTGSVLAVGNSFGTSDSYKPWNFPFGSTAGGPPYKFRATSRTTSCGWSNLFSRILRRNQLKCSVSCWKFRLLYFWRGIDTDSRIFLYKFKCESSFISLLVLIAQYCLPRNLYRTSTVCINITINNIIRKPNCQFICYRIFIGNSFTLINIEFNFISLRNLFISKYFNTNNNCIHQ